MSRLKYELDKELEQEVDRIEKEIRGVFINAVDKAKEVTIRVDTGFMKGNWFFSTTKEHSEIDRGDKQVNASALSASSLSSWSLGDSGFIVNRTKYVSYHDTGTIYMYPLFLTFQIEEYIKKELSKIK